MKIDINTREANINDFFWAYHETVNNNRDLLNALQNFCNPNGYVSRPRDFAHLKKFVQMEQNSYDHMYPLMDNVVFLDPEKVDDIHGKEVAHFKVPYTTDQRKVFVLYCGSRYVIVFQSIVTSFLPKNSQSSLH